MILSHYAAQPLEALKPTNAAEGHTPYKPRGLWLSVDGEDDWPAWCVSEGFGLDRLKVRHAVTLRADARILHLRDANELVAFTREFAKPEPSHRDSMYIDWEKVGAKHQGLIIAPYCWQKRLDLMWYYGWDCASGCIWDVSAIKTFEVDPAWVAPASREEAA